jgi:hypothetical protein
MNKITVLFPGGFKPLTGAHMELANRYAKHPKVDKVIMLIGPKQRETITRDQTLEVFRILNKNPKIKMEETPLESPLAAAYEYLFNAIDGTYALAAGGKDDDYARVGQFISSIDKYKTVGDKSGKKINPNVHVAELKVSVTPLRYDDGKPISASSTRDAMKINSYDQFAQSYPGVDNKRIGKIYKIYKGTDKIFGEIPTSQTHTEAIFTRKWWNQVFENVNESDPCWSGYKQVGTKKKGNRTVPNCVPESINEGGAGGHMSHPFDIPSVNSGKDLVRVFVQSEDYLTRKPASVKIDGVNASIRLVNVAGKHQFVLDRGSNKELDVKGITKADLLDRFGAGHGMIEIGGKVLDIFNDAIPDTTAELKRLGLWDNPNILFNIEYVAGSTNVLSYNKNFLAIHGLLEIEQVTPKRRATREIPFNKKAMQDYINKLAPTANEYGYEVLGSVPTTLENEPDFAGELSKRYTININGKKETKSLNDWLSTAKNPKDKMIKTKDGKTIGALSKQVLLNISKGMDVSEFVADPKDYQSAIDGYIFYLATMQLGDAVLEVLSSPLGKVSEHEGIVIRDPKIYNKPFKITGKFIVKGLESSFG